METFLWVTVIGVVLSVICTLFIWFVSAATDGRYTEAAVVFIVACVIVSLIIEYMPVDESKPCLEYKTVIQYNAATKTMMPAKYCQQYGKWENKKEK